MFEIANARERQMLALDATPPVAEEPAEGEADAHTREPSEEDLAVSPRHWRCLWSID